MRRIVCWSLLAVALMATKASAAVTVSMDMDTSADGIQSVRNVTNGEAFDVGVILSITDASTVGGYIFSIRMDDLELSFNGSSVSPPPGLASGGTPAAASGGAARQAELGDVPYLQLAPFSALGFGTSVPVGEYQIATLQLTADTVTTDGFLDILPGLFRPGSDLFLDGSEADISGSVVFNGGSITAVPEPGTWAILGLASAGVAWRRARRKGTSVAA